MSLDSWGQYRKFTNEKGQCIRVQDRNGKTKTAFPSIMTKGIYLCALCEVGEVWIVGYDTFSFLFVWNLPSSLMYFH